MPEPSHMFAHVLCLPLSNTIIITCDYLIEANEKKNNKCTLSLLKNATYKDVKKKKKIFRIPDRRLCSSKFAYLVAFA